MNKNLAKSNSKTLMPWSVFDSFVNDLDLPLKSENFIPKIEVKDVGTSYQVSAEVPGMNEKDISITLNNNTLVIEGEKRSEVNHEEKKGFYHSEFTYGSFYRAIPLSEDIDREKISATYKNGVLQVDLAKLPEKMTKARKIEIKSAQSDNQKIETKH